MGKNTRPETRLQTKIPVWVEREEDGGKIVSIIQKAQETESAKKDQEDYHRFVSYKKPEKERTITIVGPWNVPRLSSVGYVVNHTRDICPGHYPTKIFCNFCKIFTPVPRTSVSSLRHSNTRTREFRKLCAPVPQIPVVPVQHLCTCPELL